MTSTEITVIIIAAVVGLIAAILLVIVLIKMKSGRKPGVPEYIVQKPSDYNGAVQPDCSRLIQMLADHAKDFEGLYESVYISCSSSEAFDADAYHEWSGRVNMSPDKAFAAEFNAVFADSQDPEYCRSRSAQLLSLIEMAGIKRIGEAGEKLVIDEANAERFTCLNSQAPLGKSCTIVKPVWIYGSKVIEPGVAMADNT